MHFSDIEHQCSYRRYFYKRVYTITNDKLRAPDSLDKKSGWKLAKTSIGNYSKSSYVHLFVVITSKTIPDFKGKPATRTRQRQETPRTNRNVFMFSCKAWKYTIFSMINVFKVDLVLGVKLIRANN